MFKEAMDRYLSVQARDLHWLSHEVTGLLKVLGVSSRRCGSVVHDGRDETVREHLVSGEGGNRHDVRILLGDGLKCIMYEVRSGSVPSRASP